MDHIPRPKSPIRHLDFPYYGASEYDNGDFMSYPERQGWDPKLLARHDYRPSSHERALPEVLAFLQTWLYFGFLAAFLDEPIDIKNFIGVNRSGDAVITTKSLPDYLVRWAVRMRVLSSIERKRLYLKKGQIISFVADCSRVLNYKLRNSPHTLPRILGLFIAILGETLGCANGRVLGAGICGLESNADGSFRSWGFGSPFRFWIKDLQNQGWSESDISRLTRDAKIESWGFHPPLHHWFENLGWCENDVLRLDKNVLITGSLFASMMTRRENVSHGECTDRRCGANDMDEQRYQTKHVRSDCTCEFVQPDQSKIKAILHAGGIPLLSVFTCGVTGELRLEVIQRETEDYYTAFSHVWSDGLGNCNENSIPLCQARRLHELLMKSSELGIKNPLTNRWPESCPKLPIGRDNLFWLDTLCVPIERRFRRLAITRMGDTYGLCHKMLVLDAELERFSYGDRSYEESLMRISVSAWMRRVWTLQEAVMAKQFFVKFADGFLDVAAAAYHIREDSMRVSKCYDTVALECCAFFSVIKSIQDADSIFRFAPAWLAIQTRQTSRPGDEVICFASMLGKSTSELLEIEAPDKRLKALIQSLDDVPRSILWSKGPKLRDYGLRWAPSSLFGGIACEIDDLPVSFDRKGIMLRSQGALLTGLFHDPDYELCIYRDDQENDTWYKLEWSSGWHDKRNSNQYTGNDLAIIVNGNVANRASAALVSDCVEKGDEIYCRYERALAISYAEDVDLQGLHRESLGTETEAEYSPKGTFGIAKRRPKGQKWHVA